MQLLAASTISRSRFCELITEKLEATS